MTKRVIVAASLWLTIAGTPVSAQWSITEFPTHDNTLYESILGENSNGSGDFLFAGSTNEPVNALRRAVIRFDIPFDPSGCEFPTVAELTLFMSRSGGGIADVSLHRLTHPWGEGASDAPNQEGQGAPSQIDDATWIHAFYDTSLWVNPGGDYVVTPSATLAVNGEGYYTWSDGNINNDVRFWMCNPDSNFGWIMLGDEVTPGSSKRFNSRHYLDTIRQPHLKMYISHADCFDDIDLGDMNSDFFYDAVDLNLLIDVLFFGEIPGEACGWWLSDLNCNKVSDAVDLNYMIEFLFFGGTGPCRPDPLCNICP